MSIFERKNCKVIECTNEKFLVKTNDGRKILIRHYDNNIKCIINEQVNIKYVLDLLGKTYRLIDLELI